MADQIPFLMVTHRRRHNAQFKAQVVQACQASDISVAAVAMYHQLNANLVRRWILAHNAPASNGEIVRWRIAVPGGAGKMSAAPV
jgi:transposase-like protein